MKILDRFDFALSWEDLLLVGRSKRGRTSGEVTMFARRAWEEGLPLLDPKAAIELYQCGKISQEAGTVELVAESGRDERLFVGPKVGYLAPAQQIGVVVCTIGGALENKMRAYSEAREDVLAYYFDVLGTKAVNVVNEASRTFLQEYAKERGWGVGPGMKPGSVTGWTVTGQRDLLRLSRGREIGMTINDSCLLIPFFSGSYIAGMGPDYGAEKIGSLCPECPRYETCLWRRESGSL